jgi:hypothetical protein
MFSIVSSHEHLNLLKIFLQIKKTQMHPGNFPEPAADDQFDKNFKPKGAIAFFILLVILGLIIWFGIYFLMMERI